MEENCMEYCYNCMTEISHGSKCSKCGYVNADLAPAHRLKPGTVLSGRYIIGNALGEGGFGITYIGFDKRLEMKVAVKEFFPSGFVTRFVKDSSSVEIANQKYGDFFKSGKEQFLREARMIARFSNESGIVDVRDFFEENGTAYIVMEHIDGKNLKVYMREHGLFKTEAIITLIRPIFDALEKVHNVGLIHRDISPDNIMFTKDSKLKLMDFGAAKTTDNDMTAKGSIILKPGYAPPEQYKRDGKQGPWTDVYALCATLYKCITGVTPEESTMREDEDSLKVISDYGVSIDRDIEQAIMEGLNPNISKRIKSVSDLKERIYSHMDQNQLSTEDSTTVLYVDDNNETMVIDENFAQLDSDDEINKEKTIDELNLMSAPNEEKAYNNENSDLENSISKERGRKKFIIISVIISLVIIVIGLLAFVGLSNKNSEKKNDNINTALNDDYNDYEYDDNEDYESYNDDDDYDDKDVYESYNNDDDYDYNDNDDYDADNDYNDDDYDGDYVDGHYVYYWDNDSGVEVKILGFTEHNGIIVDCVYVDYDGEYYDGSAGISINGECYLEESLSDSFMHGGTLTDEYGNEIEDFTTIASGEDFELVIPNDIELGVYTYNFYLLDDDNYYDASIEFEVYL